MTRWVRAVVTLLLSCVALAAQATPISNTPSIRFTGQYNYVTTGGSLRTESNSGNVCAIGSSSSQSLTGIPGGAAIVAAYLYWGGSGGAPDSLVTLNGNAVNANRTFTETSTNVFFGGFADVTSLVTGNGTFTFSGLSVNSGEPYCSVGNVMAGWALVVVYGSTSEPLRAINIFDGLQAFYNSQLSLTVNGFRIPAGGIDGKMTAITWEGDDNLGGASEFLTFGGNTLTPLQGYNSSSIFIAGSAGTATYGADVDTYNISPYLSSGATSYPTVYSAGGDRVFLTAQVISVTSEPVVDLSIAKSHTGNFTVGSNGAFTLHVANGNGAGIIAVDYPITVTDVLPAGLSFVSGIGTGWSCSATGQTVTCINPNSSNLAPGNALPDITLTVGVGNGVFPVGNTAQNVSIGNTATVAAAGTMDITSANNTATDTVTVLGSNLSTSAKTVSDLNGGEANIGDTLRYTITLINSTAVAATGASVTDNVPGNVSGFSVVSIPAGATNSSTGAGTGTNNTGLLNITNINVPANGSVTIVFDVTVATGTSPGATINNTATINNAAGVGAAPSAPSIVVSPSQMPGSGTKQLYLWSSPGNLLSRTRPTGTHNAVTVAAQGGSVIWTLTPVLQSSVTLQSGNFLVPLLLSESGSGSSRSITVTLSNTTLGTIASASQTITLSGTPTLTNFTLNTSGVVAPAGSAFTLTIANTTNIAPNAATRVVNITPYTGATYSRVELNSLTVINVDSVQTYNATYAGGVATASFVRGSTAYVRAVVSDPFGSFDISSSSITLRDPSGTDVVTAVGMAQVNDSGAATKIYQYTYAIPANAPAGVWSARVTANEGVEGVNDLGLGTFTVTIPLPTLQVSKISEIVSDPVNNTANPKRIPGSIIRYTITVTNTGPGSVDASTLVMTDVVPANTTLCVAAGCGGVPAFIDGTPPAASGLSFNYASNVAYSAIPGGGTPFSHTANPDAGGFDAAITGIRIAPTGTLSAAGAGNPGFSIRFYVKVN